MYHKYIYLVSIGKYFKYCTSMRSWIPLITVLKSTFPSWFGIENVKSNWRKWSFPWTDISILWFLQFPIQWSYIIQMESSTDLVCVKANWLEKCWMWSNIIGVNCYFFVFQQYTVSNTVIFLACFVKFSVCKYW